MFVAALFALAGSVRADDLEDQYTKLKEAVEKKDAAMVKSAGAAAFKLAQDVINAPQPKEADQVNDLKQRVDYGKDVVNYTEYALSATAMQVSDPAQAIDLVNTLLAQNGKSKYLDECAPAYLAALGKNGGAAKQVEGMKKIIAGRPENEVALQALTEGLANRSPNEALNYANRLVAVLGRKSKPEGVSEGAWEQAKTAGLASGYYIAGAINASKQNWADCDRDMKAALPLIKDSTRLGVVNYYLGLSNYQMAKITLDKPRMQLALKYMQAAAGIPGPMKEQAQHNVLAIQNEIQGRK
jgi:hypothetical protein